jgi:hypothetical protein
MGTQIKRKNTVTKMKAMATQLAKHLWQVVKNYCIESTGHGFKYIVTETLIIAKIFWVKKRSSPLLCIVGKCTSRPVFNFTPRGEVGPQG